MVAVIVTSVQDCTLPKKFSSKSFVRNFGKTKVKRKLCLQKCVEAIVYYKVNRKNCNSKYRYNEVSAMH